MAGTSTSTSTDTVRVANRVPWQPTPAERTDLGAGGGVDRDPQQPVPRPGLPLPHGQLDADLVKTVRHAAWMRQGFYIVVLLVALGGQVTGAVQALHIPVIVAVPAVAALELGGIVVMANADVRRRLGERAVASRVLSAGIAAGAVAFNWLAHPNHLLGGFFAGMSGLGYLVWLMHAENQRRDRLRANGDLPPTAPAYEVLGHWLRHPLITRRARSMAKADPRLGLYDSLAAARVRLRRERRDAAIAKVLHRKIRAAVDPATADIAVRIYDLDEIAARLAEGADYDGLTALIAADLTPARIATAPDPVHGGRRWFRRGRLTLAPADQSPPNADDVNRSARPEESAVAGAGWQDGTTPQRGRSGGRGGRSPAVPPAEADASLPDPQPRKAPTSPAGLSDDQDRQQQAGPNPATAQEPPAAIPSQDQRSANGGANHADAEQPADPDPEPSDAEVPKETAAAVAYWLSRNPLMEFAAIAERIGRSERTVRRNLPPGFQRPPPTATRAGAGRVGSR
jgi:hypothetical protein